jgi:hypothetical protein
MKGMVHFRCAAVALQGHGRVASSHTLANLSHSAGGLRGPLGPRGSGDAARPLATAQYRVSCGGAQASLQGGRIATVGRADAPGTLRSTRLLPAASGAVGRLTGCTASLIPVPVTGCTA